MKKSIRKLMHVCALCVCALCLCVREEKTQFAVLANESTTDTSITDLEVSTGDEDTTLKEEFNKLLNEYVLPLLTGISSATVLGVFLAFRSSKKAKELREKMTESLTTFLNSITNISVIVQTMIDKVNEQSKNDVELKESIKDVSRKLIKFTEKSEKSIANLEAVKQSVVLLANIESKIAMSSKENVVNGIGEEISKLNETIRKL